MTNFLVLPHPLLVTYVIKCLVKLCRISLNILLVIKLVFCFVYCNAKLEVLVYKILRTLAKLWLAFSLYDV
jgi:hypothetical protein